MLRAAGLAERMSACLRARPQHLLQSKYGTNEGVPKPGRWSRCCRVPPEAPSFRFGVWTVRNFVTTSLLRKDTPCSTTFSVPVLLLLPSSMYNVRSRVRRSLLRRPVPPDTSARDTYLSCYRIVRPAICRLSLSCLSCLSLGRSAQPLNMLIANPSSDFSQSQHDPPYHVRFPPGPQPLSMFNARSASLALRRALTTSTTCESWDRLTM